MGQKQIDLESLAPGRQVHHLQETATGRAGAHKRERESRCVVLAIAATMKVLEMLTGLEVDQS